MPTIKDALDIIGKLTVAEQESLKPDSVNFFAESCLIVFDGRNAV